MHTHATAAAEFISNHAKMAKHDSALWFIREKRDAQAKSIPEWEALREMASEIKQHVISRWDHYLEEFERNATANGIHVHWATDAKEHNQIVYDLVLKHGGRKIIKSKSMLTEECHLVPYLKEQGIEAIESDLGERIMQLLGLPPSHIVMPAIGVTRQEVGTLFEHYLHAEKGNDDPTYLAQVARKSLRTEFLTADIAMTGVNFAIASSGAFVVCTNEGNADMGTSFPNLHIASMGMEKVIPDYEALSVFTRLLGRSGTGQPVTAYTSHYKIPEPGKEIHLIIVDNGRSDILEHPAHTGMLKCLRCGACMDTCPVYRRSGGYAYSYFIPGPLGINLGMLKSPSEHHTDVAACSLCFSCSNVCPAKIDLAEQIYRWRQELDALHLAQPAKKQLVKEIDWMMKTPTRFYTAIAAGRTLKHLPRPWVYNSLNAWGKERELPDFAPESFNKIWKKHEYKRNDTE